MARQSPSTTICKHCGGRIIYSAFLEDWLHDGVGRWYHPHPPSPLGSFVARLGGVI
jgi:hypothetical protein